MLVLTMRVLFFLTLLTIATAAQQTVWRAGTPVLRPGPASSFDETAVKDPSIVRFNGAWHVFYTARGLNQYTLGYVSAATMEGLQSAPRHQLANQHGTKSSYAAAPQVFYFRPHKKWYLVYQTTDSNYQPVFSTTATIDRPASWSAPQPLLEKVEKTKWIDFWVICDEKLAYLFYTRDHKDVYVRTTRLVDFPKGFGEARPVFAPVHESVHIYRANGSPANYKMLFESSQNGLRHYGLAEAAALGGPWKVVTPDFADGAQLLYSPGAEVWTNEVSHGELIRSGYDETLEVNWRKIEFLIQGMPAALHKGEYTALPWSLGVIRK